LQVHAERDASQLGVVDGLALYDQQGEMVITKPFPNMPVGFWGPGGEQRYHEAYISAEPKRTPAGFRTPSDRPKTVTPFVKLCTSTQSPWVQTAGFFCAVADEAQPLSLLPQATRSTTSKARWSSPSRSRTCPSVSGPKTVTPFVKLCTSTQSPWVQTAGFFCGNAS
jgi:hypothetical protein